MKRLDKMHPVSITDSIGVILLAAGASTRFGEVKQLLQFRGETLLRRSARAALAIANRVVVTLGANFERLREEIEDLPVEIAENKDWKTGMSGSIRIGLEKLMSQTDDLKAVVLMVCDQPFADENLLGEIIRKFEQSGSLIVACEYENTLGVPALFSATLFPEILSLDSTMGAKQLIKKYEAQTSSISFPAGAFDIDTAADYKNLLKKFC